MNLLLLAAVLITLFLIYHFYYKRLGWPPGPMPLPFLGNLASVATRLEGAFLDWKKQYGPVYTFWLGSQPIVVIADYPTMVETLQKDADSFTGRHYMELFNVIRGGDYGVITASGELWREQRRFALHILRDFGLGKNLMQERVLDEVSALIKRVKTELDNKCCDKAGDAEINLSAFIDLGVGSLINALLFGYRFDGERIDEFYELKRLVHRQLKGSWSLALMAQKPALFSHLPYFRDELGRYIAGFRTILHFFDERIREHQRVMDEKEVHDDSEPPTDYVYAFLQEMRRRNTEAPLQVPHHFTTAQLQNMCLDLWLAGQETTSTTIAWGIAYILHQPKMAEPMYAELDRLLGEDGSDGGNNGRAADRLITMADKPRLPYTCAVVQETLRIANILVNAIVANRAIRDVWVQGVLIREGSPVLPQIAALNYDEEVFAQPREFNPWRFLDVSEDGEGKRVLTLKKVDEFAPFSVGKRQCLGEALARMELFLFMANIFNQFRISAGKRLPSLRRRIGVTVQCHRYTCRVVKRHLDT